MLSEPPFDTSFLRSGCKPLPPYNAGILAVLQHQVLIPIENPDES